MIVLARYWETGIADQPAIMFVCASQSRRCVDFEETATGLLAFVGIAISERGQLMINRLTSTTLKIVLSFAGLLVAPAFAQEYQVSVTLANNTFPAPLSYTFDTTTPFQAGNVGYTNLSVVFDSACGSSCRVTSLEYNSGGSELDYRAGLFTGGLSTGCLLFLGSGSCTVDPLFNITHVGTYSGLLGGSITVRAVSSVPEPESYVEFAGMGLGLAFFGLRRFSRSHKTA
jgi:hypothetical protein